MACPDVLCCRCYKNEKSALSSKLRKAFIDEKCHEEIIKRIIDTKIRQEWEGLDAEAASKKKDDIFWKVLSQFNMEEHTAMQVTWKI